MQAAISGAEMFSSAQDIRELYRSERSSGVPKILERYMPSCSEVARIFADVADLCGETVQSLAVASKVSEPNVVKAMTIGKGDMPDILALCRALGIKPVALPSIAELSEGSDE